MAYRYSVAFEPNVFAVDVKASPPGSKQLQQQQQQQQEEKPPEYVTINLRGTKFLVETQYLKRHPDSLLCKTYGDAFQNGGKVDELYFDHNPALFQHIWDAYSMVPGAKMHMPNNYCTRYVENELDYWGLDPSLLELCCWDHLMQGQENDETRAAVLREWDKLDTHKPRKEALPLKSRLHFLVEVPLQNKWATVYMCFITMVTFLSIITWVMESLPVARHIIAGKEDVIRNATSQITKTYLRNSVPSPILWYLDIGTAVVLLSDYIFRCIVSPNKLKFFIDILNMSDFLGLLPVLIVVAIEIYNRGKGIDRDEYQNIMHIFNILRMLRVVRMFRLIRMYKPFKVVFWAWKASWQELLLLFIIITVFSCMFGSIIYYIELHEDLVLNIPHGMWWALITMTTVGYGDVAPTTAPGAFVGCLCAITGLLVIAMPIPVIVQNFHRYYEAVQTTSRLKRKPEKLVSDSFISHFGHKLSESRSSKIVPMVLDSQENLDVGFCQGKRSLSSRLSVTSSKLSMSSSRLSELISEEKRRKHDMEDKEEEGSSKHEEEEEEDKANSEPHKTTSEPLLKESDEEEKEEKKERKKSRKKSRKESRDEARKRQYSPGPDKTKWNQ